MKDLADLGAWLASRAAGHVELSPSTLPDPTFMVGGRELVSFSSNNYLGLATSARLKARACDAIHRYGVGNCESRLLGGDLEIYETLETRLAEIKQKEAALLFATGYLTNLSVLPTLVKAGNLARAFGYTPRASWKHAFFADEFNHLSLREGIRASGAPVLAYRHADMADLEQKLRASAAQIKIVVTDGVFSQHGDVVPLPDLMTLADAHDAFVYIDDAHGTGVLGPTGAGTAEHFGIDSARIIHMGTLSKAYGCIGGFVATEAHVVEILRFGCSAFGFTSTLPPDQASALLEAIAMVRDEPERRERLWGNQRYFVDAMIEAGFALPSTATPIVPLCVGDERECERVAAALRDRGIHVDAIIFPAVPAGESRLRFILNANHTREQIDRVVDTLSALRETAQLQLHRD